MATGAQSCDVAVVGCGPGGASAARVLAGHGLDVVMIEKQRLPRYKTCGGGVLGRVAGLIGEPLGPVTEKACHTASFALNEQLCFTVSRDQPIVYMTMRDAFDQWLSQKAIDAGARLWPDTAVRDVALDRDGVRLVTTRGEVRARFVVAADGANSIVAKQAGWPEHRHLAPALEYEVSVRPEDHARLSDTARFDFDPVPNGYAWVFPKASHLSIGVITMHPRPGPRPRKFNLKNRFRTNSGTADTRRSTQRIAFNRRLSAFICGYNPVLKHSLNRCLEKYLEQLGIAQPVSVQRHGFVVPLAPRDRVLARDGVLLVGDTAGFADPLTAEGIGHAIQSGRLAGRAIAASFPDRQRVCAAYHTAVQHDILPTLRWARRLARLMYETPRLRDALFARQGQRLVEVMTDLVAGRHSYRDLMTNPVNYLKLLRPQMSRHRARQRQCTQAKSS